MQGHLIASSLGGSPDWFNLAPQTSAVNRNHLIPTGWRQRENEQLRQLILGNTVDIIVFLLYEPCYLGNPQNNRPLAFKFCYRYRRFNDTLGHDMTWPWDCEDFVN
jgi:DNA/RNA non-specific endonuclease